MQIKVICAGPLTTVQDKGRFGYMEFGVGQSGVMDYRSYIAANELVGNAGDEAVLEATLLGPTLLFENKTVIAYTGADMQASMRCGETKREMERGKTYYIPEGTIIDFGMAKTGIRSYIAIAGGIDVPKIMGSRSTDLKARNGGFQGRKLAEGDILKGFSLMYSAKKINMLLNRNISAEHYTDEICVRVIEGAQKKYFTRKGIRTFYNSEYKVSNDSDRMGIRLSGKPIESFHGTDIVSDGIVFGSVQVSSSGQPIILMADHQTTGGYAKIATVIKEDLPLLAQAKQGDKVTFKKLKHYL